MSEPAPATEEDKLPRPLARGPPSSLKRLPTLTKLAQEEQVREDKEHPARKVVARDGRMLAMGTVPRRNCVLLPWFKVLIVWDALSVFFLTYTATYLPFRLAFVRVEGTPPKWNWNDPVYTFEFIIDVFFLLDIIKNFRTAYVNEQGEVVHSGLKIAIQYLRTWFVLDITASAPLEWFTSSVPDSTSDGLLLLRLAKLGKMVRLLRILRLSRISLRTSTLGAAVRNGINEVLQSNTLYVVARAIAIFALIHWIACLQYLISDGAELDAPEDSWVVRAGIDPELPILRRWTMAITHVELQLLNTGHGLVAAERTEEFWMLNITLLVGLVTTGALVAALASKMVSELRASSCAYKEKVQYLEEWMKTMHMPAELKAKLRAHLECKSKYPGGRSYNERTVLDELSLPLRRELRLHQAQQVIDAFLGTTRSLYSAGLKGSLALNLERTVYVHGDRIASEGRRADGLHFIDDGEVVVDQCERDAMGKLVLNPIDRKPALKTIATLGHGDLFGEMSLLNATGLSEASVTATSLKVVAFVLSCESYHRLVVDFPELRAFVEGLMRARHGGRSAELVEGGYDQRRFDAFLSHAWSKDLHGRDTHARVSTINDALRMRGIRTWFDNDELTGDINSQMADGIDNSAALVVFVTSDYNIKVAGDGPNGENDNCKYEFDYALLRKGVERMVPVVMEEAMRSTKAWKGTLGGTSPRLGSHAHCPRTH